MGPRMVRMVQGSTDSEGTGRRLYVVINRLVVHPMVQRTGVPASSTRWELAISQLIGIAVLRYVVRLEPIASATIEEVVELSAPSIRVVLRPPGQSGIAPGLARMPSGKSSTSW